MSTFDQILPSVTELFSRYINQLNQFEWLLVNRDLNGRVRFIAPDVTYNDDRIREQLEHIYRQVAELISPHAYPLESGILYESSKDFACKGASAFSIDGFDNIFFIDRLATTSRWESIEAISTGSPRIVFFSIKGGVGRSTALAASAWALAKRGKRVLVLDLDLESPGLSSALLPTERQPTYGITDWLVEDLVDNGDALLNDMYATSDLPTAGPIYIVPAHGRNPGEYVSKLGRVWMPKVNGPDHEAWPSRLNRLVNQLEQRFSPDAILIDSRAGIDDVAAACISDLGADTILMFAIQGTQTWSGYRSLFRHWQQRNVITHIRERLQLVAGLVPDEDRLGYLELLRADAYALFEDTYDQAEAGAVSDFNFEEDDDNAPHSPLPVRWNRGWYGLLSLQQRMQQVDESEVTSVYGPLLDFLNRTLVGGNEL